MTKNYLSNIFNKIFYSNINKFFFTDEIKYKLQLLNKNEVNEFLLFLKKKNLFTNKSLRTKYYSIHTEDIKKLIIYLFTIQDKTYFNNTNNLKIFLFFYQNAFNKEEKDIFNIKKISLKYYIYHKFLGILSFILDILFIFLKKLFKKEYKICVLNNYPRISFIFWYLETTLYYDKIYKKENKYLLFITNNSFNTYSLELFKNNFKSFFLKSSKKRYIFNFVYNYLNKYDSKFIHKFLNISSNLYEYKISSPNLRVSNNIELEFSRFLSNNNLIKFKYVIMNVRDDSYYNDLSKNFNINPNRFSRTFHRNPNKKNYSLFNNFIKSKQMELITIVSQNLIKINDNLINITNEINLILQKYSFFSIACNTGSYLIPHAFRRPYLILDDTSFNIWFHNSNLYKKNLLSFAKVLNLKKNKFLTIKEIQKIKVHEFTQTDFSKNHLKIIFNNPNENLSYLEEMYERTNSLWKERKDEKNLSKIFKENIYRSSLLYGYSGVISYNWLKNNLKLMI